MLGKLELALTMFTQLNSWKEEATRDTPALVVSHAIQPVLE
jgi:hypothetical protein